MTRSSYLQLKDEPEVSKAWKVILITCFIVFFSGALFLPGDLDLQTAYRYAIHSHNTIPAPAPPSPQSGESHDPHSTGDGSSDSSSSSGGSHQKFHVEIALNSDETTGNLLQTASQCKSKI